MNSKFYFLISFFLALLIAKPSSSQVSDGTVRSTIKSKCVNDPSTLLKIEFNKGSTKKELESSGWVYYHTRSYTLKFSTPYKGVNYIAEGAITFKKKPGGNYYYMNHAVYYRYYTGIPAPEVSEINKVLNSIPPEEKIDLKYNVISVDSPVKVASNTDWYWTGYNEVRFIIEFDVTLDKGTTLEKKRYQHYLTLNRSTDGINYDKDAGLLKDGQWINLKKEHDYLHVSHYISSEKGGSIVDLGEETITSEEADKLLNLEEKYYENLAKKKWACLDTIKIPQFKYANEARLFVFQTFWEGDTSKIKSMVYQMMPTREMGYKHFSEWSSYVLSPGGETHMKDAIEDGPKLKSFYCKTPIYRQKKDSYGYMGDDFFWCKKMKLTTSIFVKKHNEKWYLTGFRMKVRGDEEAYTSMHDSLVKCGKPAFFNESNPPEFNVGDPIKAKARGRSWHSKGTVEEILYSKGKYKVKIGNDRNAYTDEVPAEFVKLNDEYKAPSEKKNSNSSAENKTETEQDQDQEQKPKQKKKKKKKKKIKGKIKIGGFKIGG